MVSDKSLLAASTRMFSSAVFHQLAKRGKSPIFARLVRELGRDKFPQAATVSDAFESTFKSIDVPGRRDEYVYKAAITEKVLLGRHSLRTASMLTEVRVAGSKADVVVLNGTSTVYEIKSERDSLARLPGQLDSYRRAFASVNVITSEAHLDCVLNVAPSDVGVLILNRRGRISRIREAVDCPRRITPSALLSVLRISEAIEVLIKLGVTVPSVPNTERFSVVQELFEKQVPVALHLAALAVLKRSRTQVGLQGLLMKLPISLRAAALSTPIRQADQVKLVKAVETPLLEAEHWG